MFFVTGFPTVPLPSRFADGNVVVGLIPRWQQGIIDAFTRRNARFGQIASTALQPHYSLGGRGRR